MTHPRLANWPHGATVSRSLLPLLFFTGFGTPSLTFTWTHEPGPFAYRLYTGSDLRVPPIAWTVITQVNNLSITLPILHDGQPHFFALTCIDTYTGRESDFAR
jgi:hypothetical protein